MGIFYLAISCPLQKIILSFLLCCAESPGMMLNRSGEKGQPYPLDLSSSLLIWGEKNNFINIIFDTCKVFIDILYQIKEVSPDSFPGLTCKVFCRGDRRGYRRSFLFSCRTAIPLSHLWITSALLRDFFFFLISLWVLCSIQVDKVCRRKQSPSTFACLGILLCPLNLHELFQFIYPYGCLVASTPREWIYSNLSYPWCHCHFYVLVGFVTLWPQLSNNF